MKKIVILTMSLAFLLSGCYTSSALDTVYDSGYENGREDGYSEGYDDGYGDGYSEGCEYDTNGSYEYGYDCGYDCGYDEGYYDAYVEIYGKDYFDSSQEATEYGTDFDSTWGRLIESNGGEPVWGTLTPEQQALVNYPYLNPDKVYFVMGGNNYHSVDWCYTLQKSDEIYYCKLSLVTNGEMSPCSKCVGDN